MEGGPTRERTCFYLWTRRLRLAEGEMDMLGEGEDAPEIEPGADLERVQFNLHLDLATG